MESSTGAKLLQQAEKILLHPIHPHLISYCPTMDLIAVVTNEENLDVYRINGQRAFGLKRKSPDISVDCICWQFNGQAIAVAWSDGFTDILSAETGKVIHSNIAVPSVGSETPRIQSIGWSLNFIDVEAVKRRTGLRKGKPDDNAASIDFSAEATDDWDAFKDDTTIEDFLQRQPDIQALDIAPDLPDQLAMMDMETLLPKLPAIPLPPANPFMRMGQQADSGGFSSQAQVDSLLHSHYAKDHNSVDMFIRCTNTGTVHPSIYDSLETVNIRLPEAWPIESNKPLLHTSHPYSCSHGILTEVKVARDDQKKLAFIPLTIGFIPSAGIYLHLIASKTSQLQNLLLYVQQCLQRIRTYWKHSQDLPSKFMMNISETLEEKGQGDLVQNLYHLACTGNCPPLLKEWLVDELQEAGHKRWDNTVVSSLTTVLQLIHENLLPAIDRCTIVISRIRGLAQYHDSGWIFSTPVTTFTALLGHLETMRLLAHTTLLYAGDEKRQFLSFSKWLRYEIDVEATEPDSQSRTEMESRDPGVDIAMVLDYIRYGLTQSDLAPYLIPEDQLTVQQKKAAPYSYDDTRKAIDLVKKSAAYKPEALCLDHVFHHFKTGCTTLFQQISHWQESNISMDCGMVLEEGPVDAVDMRMVVDPSQPDTISTHIAVCPSSNKRQLHIHRLTHTPTIISLPKAIHSYAATTLQFPLGGAVLDAKFTDDKHLLVLLQLQLPGISDKTSLILFLPYTTSSSITPSSSKMNVIPYNSDSTPSISSRLLPAGAPPLPSARTIRDFSIEEIKQNTRHVFEGRFTPLKLIVNGQKGRRVVVVLGSDKKHYRVLDLDYKEKKNGAHPDEGKGEGDGAESSSEESDDGDDDIEMGGA